MDIIDIAKGLVGPIVAGFWSHMNLTRYAIFRLQRFRRGVRTYDKEQDFWRDLIGSKFYSGGRRKLQLGSIVRLESFQLTEWFPRCPGVYWTREGTYLRRQAQANIETVTPDYLIHGPTGKYKMIVGGLGTNRTLSHQTPTATYRILCATSSGVCDAGIPIVVVDDVCAAIQEPIADNYGIEVDLEGRLVELPFSPEDIVVPARGAELDLRLRDWLSTALHVPRYFILVESSLQAKKYVSDFLLKASAWSMYGREMHTGIIPSFTYATFNPRDSDSLDRATAFIIRYIESHGGTTIYTDFDEHVRRLDSKYSLEQLMGQSYDREEAKNDIETFLAWGHTIEDVRVNELSWR